jgi:hypothetical protein
VHTGFWWTDLREGNHLGDRWEDNIKMDLQEVGWGMDRIEDRWRALVNTVVNLRIP